METCRVIVRSFIYCNIKAAKSNEVDSNISLVKKNENQTVLGCISDRLAIGLLYLTFLFVSPPTNLTVKESSNA